MLRSRGRWGHGGGRWQARPRGVSRGRSGTPARSRSRPVGARIASRSGAPDGDAGTSAARSSEPARDSPAIAGRYRSPLGESRAIPWLLSRARIYENAIPGGFVRPILHSSAIEFGPARPVPDSGALAGRWLPHIGDSGALAGRITGWPDEGRRSGAGLGATAARERVRRGSTRRTHVEHPGSSLRRGAMASSRTMMRPCELAPGPRRLNSPSFGVMRRVTKHVAPGRLAYLAAASCSCTVFARLARNVRNPATKESIVASS